MPVLTTPLVMPRRDPSGPRHLIRCGQVEFGVYQKARAPPLLIMKEKRNQQSRGGGVSTVHQCHDRQRWSACYS